MPFEDEIIAKLNRLKRDKDFKSLLKEYHSLSDTDKNDISPFLKTSAFNLLKDDLEEIEHIWKNFDLTTKEYAIEFLKDVDNEKSLLMLADCLIHEESHDIQSQIKDALCNSKILEEIRSFFYDSVVKVSGRRYEFLAEIISYIDNPHILKNILLKIKNRCPKKYEVCAKNIIPEKLFFVGHRFSKERKDDLRDCISRIIAAIGLNYEPYYVDLDYTQGDIFCKICEKIQCSEFGIYDISFEDNRLLPNPNVMLELGLSLAFGKTTIIIMREGQEVPFDLRITPIEFYRSYKELEEKLKEKLPKVLGIV